MGSLDSQDSARKRSDGFDAAARWLLQASAILTLGVAVLLSPPVLGPLASADGEIENPRFVGALWGASLLAALGAAALWRAATSRNAALAALIEACWRRRFRLAVTALALVAVSVGSLSLYLREVNHVDLLDRLEPSHPTAREVLEVARNDGEQAALDRLADLSLRRPSAATLAHPELWDVDPAESAKQRRAFVAGDLQDERGAAMVRWRPGEPVPWGGRSSLGVRFFLQRQIFLLHALRDPGAEDYPAALAAARAFAEDWRDNNPVWPSFHPAAWTDDTTANRIMAQMALMDQLRAASEVSREEESAFLESLMQHADQLVREDTYTSTTNHGMMQNVALLAIALGYPELDRGGRFRQAAIERAERYLREAFTERGVVLELTPRYQWFGTQQALWFAARAAQAGVPLDPVFEDVARKAVAISREFLQPDRTLPMIADTHGYLRSLVGWPLDDLPDWPEIRELAEAADRAEGPPNPPGARLWPEAGYFLLRVGAPEWNTESALMLVFKAGSRSRAHAHRDALSCTLYANGQPVLSGPGYPDYERATKRDLLTGTTNQNTVSVDGGSQRIVEARINFSDARAAGGTSAEPGFTAIQAEGDVYPGVLHRRSLFHGPSRGGLLIIDELFSKEEHDYRQHFRIAARADGTIADGKLRISAEPSRRFLLDVTSVGLAGGERIPLVLGIDGKVAAFQARARGLTYVSLLEASRDEPSSFTASGDAVVWQGPEGSLSIKLPLADASGYEWRPTNP